MRKAKALAVLALVAVAGGVWVYSGGCDRPKPHEPIEPDEPKDYIVYASSKWTQTVFRYHPVTRQIDSVQTPYNLYYGVTISADGKRLYLCGANSVVVVDSDSLDLITELGYSGSVAVSPNNRYIAIQRDTLRILDSRDYSEVFVDTGTIWGGAFAADGSTFYALVRSYETVTTYLYTLNLCDGSPVASRRQVKESTLLSVVPTPDGEKLLLVCNGLRYPRSFAVLDIDSDSVVHEHGVYAGTYYVAVTPDGRYAFHGNPGCCGENHIGLSEVVVFDIAANRVDRTVRTDRFIDSITPPWFEVGPIVITPDGRWLVGMNRGALLLFDVEQMKPLDLWFPDFSHGGLVKLSVQTTM